MAPIKSKTSVRRMVFLDTETTGHPTKAWKGRGNPKLHLLRLGWMCTWDSGTEKWIRFTTPDEFIENLEHFIGKNTESTYVYSYNASFDYQILGIIDRIIDRDGWEFNSSPIYRPFIVHARYRDSPVWFLDMGNHIGVRIPLKDIGHNIGVEKLGIDIANLDDIPDEEVSEYCKRDVEIVKEYMLRWLRFLRDNDLGPYRPTIASQCITTFRHRFIDHDIVIHHHPLASRIEREAYRGGRNEVMAGVQIGKEYKDVYKLDVNSFHPYIMATQKLPWHLRSGIQDPSARTLNRLVEDGVQFIVSGVVYAPKPVISVRRLVAAHIDRTIFPIGTFPATITSLDYAQLVESGGKMMKSEIAITYDSAVLFKNYINFFYEKRLESKASGDEAGNIMAKYMMNSLEGKFAQHVQLSVEVTKDDGTIPSGVLYWKDENITFKVLRYGGRTWLYTTSKQDSPNTFVAISAFIRSYTRTILWDDICGARKAGGKVYYTDTDSLLCDDKAFEYMMNSGRVDPGKLGSYKKEGIGTLVMYGPKDYIFDGKRSIKGIRADAKEISPGVFRQVYFERMQGMRRRGIKEGVIIVDEFEKRQSRKYYKGQTDKEGRVSPFQLDE